MLKQQKGKCLACKLSFQNWDVWEVDHKIPRANGGKDEYKNLQLLHRHCHDEKTAIDLIEIRQKEHSRNFNKIAQQWDKYEWEWINDVPVILGRKQPRSPTMTRENTPSTRVQRNRAPWYALVELPT
jgi:RNA-directed DNA polymerase